MNRSMLRFRPIAPKPPGGDAVFDAAEQERKKGVKRTKRKYVRVRCRQSKRKTSVDAKTTSSVPGKSRIEDSSPPESKVVTLQLLPERSDSDKSTCNDNTVQQVNDKVYEKCGVDQFTIAADLTVDIGGGSWNVRSAVETWIIVESVMDTCVDSGLGLGFSDMEKMSNLEVDTCPGFVSDSTNKVVWVNEAYRNMVGAAEAAEGGFRVWLVVKEKLPNIYPSFACRVRVIHHTRQGQKWNMIVACDVWRMDFEGFAWKLDVKTALGLSI